MAIIYHYENLKNIESAGYCGQTIGPMYKRRAKHFNIKQSGCWKFVNAIKKYGKDAFEEQIIMEVPDWAKNWFERYWIFTLGCVEYGYNITEGGDTFTPSEDMNDRNRKSHDCIEPECIETGESYKSLGLAQKYTGIPKADIAHCINDPQRFQTAGGLHWRKKGDTITIEEIESYRKRSYANEYILVDNQYAFKSLNSAASAFNVSRPGAKEAMDNNRPCKGHTFKHITKEVYEIFINNNANGESLSA